MAESRFYSRGLRPINPEDVAAIPVSVGAFRTGVSTPQFRKIILDGIDAGLTNRQIQDRQMAELGKCNKLATINKYRNN